MTKLYHRFLRRLLLIPIFLGFVNFCVGQTNLISGRILQVDSLTPITWCRIIINESMDYYPDSIGNFKISIENTRINKIEFSAIGFYKLTVENLKNCESFKFDTVALSLIRVADDYFVTIKENGKLDKRTDKKKELKNSLEMKDQASKAYVVYDKKKIASKDGLVKLE